MDLRIYILHHGPRQKAIFFFFSFFQAEFAHYTLLFHTFPSIVQVKDLTIIKLAAAWSSQ